MKDQGNRGADACLPASLELAMLLDIAPVALPADRQAALRDRVMQAIKPAPAMHTLLASEGEWRAVAPLVYEKRLFADAQMTACLYRLEPGGRIPPHVHDVIEECLVLEGEIMLDEIKVGAGGYQLAPRHSRHGDVHSPDGCLIYVRRQLAA
ncbi:cupin domain-containing protein [Chitinimonas sp.]|uniref:cupin domain-containing protein n=1 Tax=Chitinimonas sp. TaxID=1934313 RepID=UPI0035B0FACD